MTKLAENRIEQHRHTLESAIAEWRRGHVSDQRDAELTAIIKAGVRHVVSGGSPGDHITDDDDIPLP